MNARSQPDDTARGELLAALASLNQVLLGKDRELRLSRPTVVEALGGRLRLDALRWQAPRGDAGARFQFGLGVEELDLASLSQRLGWPPFTGSISGRIPSARFADDRLDIDGGLQMRVFGGRVDLRELAMERPFGSAPTLTGDVAIEDAERWVLRLVPRKDESMGALTLMVRKTDATIEEARVTDALGTTTRLRLSAEKRNERLDPGLFRFTPPAGVDVVRPPAY